ncbi:hypothetical protein KQS06HV_560003 [Klebsiella quasipneumoniae subsp. similipneumoniae]|uniref:Uncharacterized protein n=1 Tax=Salmonella sp. TaxID=599 RepID=A0A6M4NLY5_SALSP|nr:hypothetical protein [Leclercia sp.]QJR97452.1 hypothetical protein [Salmonella sp.]CTQ85997.1 hypothetical protein ECOLI_p220034 [Escherichia coli]SAM67334.1 hypothetical protein KQS06HV_560003 [Klebsiella quasipneumoniae subsp. similipneumoniae]
MCKHVQKNGTTAYKGFYPPATMIVWVVMADERHQFRFSTSPFDYRHVSEMSSQSVYT